MLTLNWIGKDKVVNHAAQVPFHVLEHKYNFGGESENKIIHGDNLIALKSLLPEYEGRVKCIYIDLPYITPAMKVGFITIKLIRLKLKNGSIK